VSGIWYYADQRGPAGPLTLKALKETLATLPNSSDMLVWREGFPGWKKAADVVELRVQTVTPPLPPEPPAMKAAEARNDLQSGMTHAIMIALTAGAALVLSVASEAESILSASRGFLLSLRNTRLAGNVVGGALSLFAISWIVAGTAYLLSLRKMSRGSIVLTSILTSVILTYLAYQGRSLSWITETVMPLAKV
jgi:hypothetical protein